ncbi:AAA-domain-containing protein [Basidiobolus meristosporus CBS 931.73]|uniref:Peroxisomal ATPase PEX6 n=1 Tax=Basidiobolus meristosporus CBS 931.73 TaxID=1314790 RepID=A0A1Y1YJX1_9FUNG|nr:AAA-domain-containing protein [Basidiobolus meristosporus CBS 931.73]|eukprot:ORX98143.1 AAA-domain-containing protein [Basidiobolus meristosporus CBS 931.73]
MCVPVLRGLVSEQTRFILSSTKDFPNLTLGEGAEEVENTAEVDVDYSYLVNAGVVRDNDCFFPLSDSEEETEAFEGKSSGGPEEPKKNESIELYADILDSRIPAELISPKPEDEEDDETFVFVRIETLGRLHLLSGDQVILEGQDAAKKRLCRVFGIEERLIRSGHTSEIFMSPCLFYNLGIKPNSATPQAIRLTYTCENAPLCTIREAVLARVPTPVSTSKTYEKAFMNALKDYFESKNRVVCEGDVIAVTIDEERARQEESGDNDEEISNFVSLRENIKQSNLTAVYFHVTAVEFSKASPPVLITGGVIDVNSTKLIQEGVSNIQVPSMQRYLGATGDIPPLPSDIPEESPFASLLDIASSSVHPLAIELGLSCSVLLRGARGNGKRVLGAWVAEKLGLCFYDVNCFDLAGETEAKTESSLRARFDIAATYAPCLFLLRNIEALASKEATVESGQEPVISSVLSECLAKVEETTKKTGQPVLVVATASDPERIPNSLLSCFRHEIEIEAPNEANRLAILKSLTAKIPLAPDVSISSLATQTAALVAKDLVDLVARAGVAGLERVSKATTVSGNGVTWNDLIEAGVTLNASDFDRALGKARASYSDSIGAPKIPNVTWDDVGGLASVKDDILDTIQLPLEHPELFASGMKKRSGILFYGPPGTGKTLLAKAVATSCSLNFFSVKGPELLNMYIGESEANVRRVFQRARDAKPCVIFFDELDSIAPKRGEKGDSGGVMDRIVSQILAELDGMSSGDGSSDVFVIGATNRPDLLDPALLRPGRFDKLLYLGISEDNDSQHNILQALTRKFRLAPDLDLRKVAEKCPFHYTGADFYALCSDAMLKAMTRTAGEIDQKIRDWNENPPLPPAGIKYPVPMTVQYYLDRLVKPEETEVLVQMVDFMNAQAELIPSVSPDELEHYKKVREQFDSSMSKEKSDAPKQEIVQSSSSSSSMHSAPESSLDTAARSDPQPDNLDSVVPNGKSKGKKKDKGKGRSY